MADYHVELQRAALRLLARRTGQRGPLPAARIRRSISTSYYALFHFLLDEAGSKLVGTGTSLKRRRRLLGRTIAHRSVRMAMSRVQGPPIPPPFDEFFRPQGIQGPVVPPVFVRTMAAAFADVHAKREEADYDLNKPFSENDARAVYRSVGRAIGRWQTANSPADRDFKHALLLLIVLKGQLRTES